MCATYRNTLLAIAQQRPGFAEFGLVLDTVGCLQDIHWAAGLFGYFPNYALGATFAAQLFESAVRDDPSVLHNLRAGDFAPYRAWVGPRIHARASQVPFAELVVDATGAPLSAESLKRQLRRRYLEEAHSGKGFYDPLGGSSEEFFRRRVDGGF